METDVKLQKTVDVLDPDHEFLVKFQIIQFV